MLGVLAANLLGFGLALAEICHTFGQPDEDMSCLNPVPKKLLNIVTSLIGPI
jgi:hypothetical protein